MLRSAEPRGRPWRSRAQGAKRAGLSTTFTANRTANKGQKPVSRHRPRDAIAATERLPNAASDKRSRRSFDMPEHSGDHPILADAGPRGDRATTCCSRKTSTRPQRRSNSSSQSTARPAPCPHYEPDRGTPGRAFRGVRWSTPARRIVEQQYAARSQSEPTRE